jgi:hypothetical protein
VPKCNGGRFIHAHRIRSVTNLNAAKRSPRPRRFESLPQARFLADQDDVQAARCDRRKNAINLDAWGSIRAHRVDGDSDLVQAFSSSLFSTTMRSL